MNRLSPTLCVFALIPALFACGEKAAPPRPEVARPAKIFTVQEPGAANQRAFPGTVQATDQAELAFRVAGELIGFPATRGLQVKQGQLLARLDPADYQSAVDQAQAQYDLAKSQFERVAELVERQLVSRAEFDQRKAMLQVRESSLAQARNNLDYTQILAPFDGIVARRMAENFESVAAGQVVLILQTGDMIDVTIDVPESIVATVERKPEQSNPPPVQVRFDSVGEATFDAYYKEHETQADPATLTYKVTFSLPAPTGVNVLPGMTATVLASMSNLRGSNATGYQLPIEAVFAAEDEPVDSPYRYVWKIDPESMRARRAAVRVGALTGDQIVVTEGIEAGELIVSAGVNAVVEGMLVRPMSREAGL